jgi:hypothetical protein
MMISIRDSDVARLTHLPRLPATKSLVEFQSFGRLTLNGCCAEFCMEIPVSGVFPKDSGGMAVVRFGM